MKTLYRKNTSTGKVKELFDYAEDTPIIDAVLKVEDLFVVDEYVSKTVLLNGAGNEVSHGPGFVDTDDELYYFGDENGNRIY